MSVLDGILEYKIRNPETGQLLSIHEEAFEGALVLL